MTGPTSIPTWIGCETGPLLGWWDVPMDGKVRGTVVVCPSLGQEQVTAYRTLRLLAESLAEQGFAVLRFDYPGTGDSADPPADSDLADAWAVGARAAMAHARQRFAVPPAVVALRVGCLIAERAIASLPEVGPVVLWHPVASGRAWLRRQAAVLRLAAADDEPRSGDESRVEVPGLSLPAGAAATLNGWRLRGPGGGAASVCGRWLTVVDPGDAMSPGRLADCDLVESADLHGLVEVEPVQAVVPLATLDRIVEWVGRFGEATVSAGSGAGQEPPAERAETIVNGVREVAGRWGDRATAGVVASPTDRPSAGCLLLLGATDHRVGPGRQWVRWSRAWAAAGLTCARLDIGGTGDSSRHDRGTPMRYYTEAAVLDTLAAAAAVQVAGSRLAALGLCAGAWTAMAAALRGRFTDVYLLNQLIWTVPPLDLGYDPSPTATAPSPIRQERPWRGRIRRALPGAASAVLDEAGLTDSPMARLAALSRCGVSATVVLGPGEASGFATLAGWRWEQRLTPPPPLGRMLRRRRRSRVLAVDGMDHAMLSPRGRAGADRAVDDLVRADFGLPR